MIDLQQALKQRDELKTKVRQEIQTIADRYAPQFEIIERIIKEARKKGIGKKIKQFTKR